MKKRKKHSDMALRLIICITLLSFPGSIVPQEEAGGVNFQEREAQKKARQIGFGDLEIDNLHRSIAGKLFKLISYGSIPFSAGSNRNFMKGRDKNNNVYFRMRLREGISFSTDERPTRYIYKAHCYLYLNTAEKNISKIIFQFYRINFSGLSYTRELRRFSHPNPISRAGTDYLKKEVRLLDNSKILLELFEEPSTTKPVWEGPDGIPQPVLTLKPKERIELNNPADMIPYAKQVKIIYSYKKMLRRIDRDLYLLNRVRALDRNIRINRILDFQE